MKTKTKKIENAAAAKRAAEKERRILNAKLAADQRAERKAAKALETTEAKPKTETKVKGAKKAPAKKKADWVSIEDEAKEVAEKRAAAKKAPAKKAPKKPAAKKAPKPAKAEGKGATILALLQRDGGATSAELMNATGWQRHSVRGYISAVVGKKLGHKVATAKSEAGEFSYSIGK